MENQVEEFAYQMAAADIEIVQPTFEERIRLSWDSVKDIIGRVWLYLLIGFALLLIVGSFRNLDDQGSVLGQIRFAFFIQKQLK